jgi:hypothetical protein
MKPNRIIKHFLATFVLAFCFFCIDSAIALAAADNYVTTTGQGISRQAAIQDAMRMALEKKIGVMLDSKTIFENNRVIEDNIYARAQGFIRDYDVINERSAGGSYYVTIHAIVDASLDTEIMNRFQKIKAVETGLQDPRIGIIITDKNSYAAENSNTAENAIIKSLMNNGFSRLIDTKQIDQTRKRQILMAMLNNNSSEVLALMSQFAVDYMIVGEVDASSQPGQSRGFDRLTSGRALLDFRVFNMNTGEIVYADTVNAAEADTNARMAVSKAIYSAANQAGKGLTNGLLRKAANPLQNIQVMINSSHSISETQNLLRNVSNVQQIYLRDSRNGFMIFDINYYGSVDTFVEQLAQAGIDVSEVSSKYVKFSY